MKWRNYSTRLMIMKSICSLSILVGLVLASYYSYAAYSLVTSAHTTTAYGGSK